jgi:hypothetical protein
MSSFSIRNGVYCIECGENEAILQWKTIENCSRYELQMKENDSEWKTLSKNLKNNEVKKKNLNNKINIKYYFRIRGLITTEKSESGEWTQWYGSYRLSEDDDSHMDIGTDTEAKPIEPYQHGKRMTPPYLKLAEEDALTIQWNSYNTDEKLPICGYHLRYRIVGGTWSIISTVIR